MSLNMDIPNYTFALTLLCEYSIVITAAMLFLQRRNIRNVHAMLFFLLCLSLYLIVDFTAEWIRYIAVSGAFLLPFSFWTFTAALFNDRSLKWQRMIILGIITLFFYYAVVTLADVNPEFKTTGLIILSAVSLAYTVMAIYEMHRQKNIDLVNSRIRFRIIFTYLASAIIIITLFAEIGFDEYQRDIPALVQKSVILLMSSFILINYTKWSSGFFTYQKNNWKTRRIEPGLIDKIKAKMTEEKLYLDEKLTIRQLAEKLGEQEYKLREAINYGMGYRNFTDFLNSYRIAEARTCLSDLEFQKHTILEIAYKTGFNSIGPFNKAFKENTGLTPTEYRKHNLPSQE